MAPSRKYHGPSLSMYKICSMCAEHKPCATFGARDRSTDGLRPECNDCKLVKSRISGKRGVCLDCGKAIQWRATRCETCYGVSIRGSNHPKYGNGKSIDKKGYVILSGMRDDPFFAGKKYALEHQYVVSHHLNRSLLPGEIIHHKNGIRTDNRIENLELCWIQPPGQRVEDLIEYLESTGYTVTKNGDGNAQ